MEFRNSLVPVVFLTAALPAWGQGPITVLHDYGANSLLGGLVQVQDGTYFGVRGNIWAGSPPPPSVVFRMSAAGAELWSYQFPADGSQGLNPNTLMQASDGMLYGTTQFAGDPAAQAGTAFRLGPSGVGILHAFKGPDGAQPFGKLVEGGDGNLYGATLNGGANGKGTVFRMDKAGNLQTIFSFNGLNGKNPLGGLVPAGPGAFFGVTFLGGAQGFGTIFRITAAGALTTLHSFSGPHACPNGLTLGPDGNFYGTTADLVVEFGPLQCFAANVNAFGSVFRITPQGVFTSLYSFQGTGVGPAFPSGPLLYGSDNSYYGVSSIGGSGFLQQGTIFRFGQSGEFTWSSFTGGTSGATPCCELLQSSSGPIVGVTQGFLDIGSARRMPSSSRPRTPRRRPRLSFTMCFREAAKWEAWSRSTAIISCSRPRWRSAACRLNSSCRRPISSTPWCQREQVPDRSASRTPVEPDSPQAISPCCLERPNS